jgi:hypothetical protein
MPESETKVETPKVRITGRESRFRIAFANCFLFAEQEEKKISMIIVQQTIVMLKYGLNILLFFDIIQ